MHNSEYFQHEFVDYQHVSVHFKQKTIKKSQSY